MKRNLLPAGLMMFASGLLSCGLLLTGGPASAFAQDQNQASQEQAETLETADEAKDVAPAGSSGDKNQNKNNQNQKNKNQNNQNQADQNRNKSQQTGQQSAMKAPSKAVAVLFPVNDSGVAGVIHLQQQGKQIQITGTVRGLEPNSEHGFHIHQFGDLSDFQKGQSVGGHFDPHGHEHGKPSADPEERHVGDLGNIKANDQGVAEINITDNLVAFQGENNVIGRAFVVHSKADQFTQPSGDAGDRIAFGVIGVADDKQQK